MERFWDNLKELFSVLRKLRDGSPQGLFHIDHIGYKCGSHAEYVAIRDMFLSDTRFIEWKNVEKISDRMIFVFELKPYLTGFFRDLYLELQDQKPDKSQVSGFDHVELFPEKGHTTQDVVDYFISQGFIVTKNTKSHSPTDDVDSQKQFGCIIKIRPGSLRSTIEQRLQEK